LRDVMSDALESGEKRDEHGRFIVPPVSPGRPKGARNKLGEAFIEAMHDSFNEHGPETIETVRTEKPDQYLKVIASLIPSEHRITINDQFSEMSDDELAQRVRSLTATLAPFLDRGTGDAGEGTGSAKGKAKPSRVH
jgi:hypothetical protein